MSTPNNKIIYIKTIYENDPLYLKYDLDNFFIRNYIYRTHNKVTKHNKLGQGTFSNVYMIYNNDSNENCAIKILKSKYQKYSRQEIYYLKRIGLHKNIIPIQDYFNYNNQICIIYPLYSCNLYQFLQKRYKLYKRSMLKIKMGLDIASVRQVAYDMLQALQYIKTKCIIHTDVKPENILIEKCDNGTIKFILCDFGSAYDGNYNLIGYHQSRFYRAPETIFRKNCSYSIDMWSIGCVLYELLFNRVLFNGKDEIELIYKIVKKRGMFTTNYINNLTHRIKYFKSMSYHKNDITKQFKKQTIRYKLLGISSTDSESWFISRNEVYQDITRIITQFNKKLKLNDNILLNFIEFILDTTKYETYPLESYVTHVSHRSLQGAPTESSENSSNGRIPLRIRKDNRLTPSTGLTHKFIVESEHNIETNRKLVYEDICTTLDSNIQ